MAKESVKDSGERLGKEAEEKFPGEKL